MLLLTCIIMAAVFGLVGGYASALPSLLSLLLTEVDGFITGVVAILELVFFLLFLVTLIWKGPGIPLAIQMITLAIITALIAFTARGGGVGAAVIMLTMVNIFVLSEVLLGSLALLLFIDLANRSMLPVPAATAVASAVIGLREGVMGAESKLLVLSFVEQICFVALVAMLLTLPFVIANQASNGRLKYRSLNKIVVAFATMFGTRFQNACLDGADFSAAKLAHCDFRGTSIIRTNWHAATGLDKSRLETTYLSNPVVRDLVVSLDGCRGTFDNMSLRDLNLDGSDLEAASFIGSDLSGCSLRHANLKNSFLAQARLYATDLSEANLTKACIENWAISTDTRFEMVMCDEVYMRLPTPDDPDPWRKPDNRGDHFKPGDFNDFIAPIIHTLGLYKTQNVDPRLVAQTLRTLDLYHYDTINPAAALLALNQLSKLNPDSSLEVVALQGKGAEKVHLQALVTGDVSSADLSHDYQELYRRAAAMPSDQLERMMAVLADSNFRIRQLETLLDTARETTTNYYIKAGGDISGIVNFGTIQGDIIHQPKSS